MEPDSAFEEATNQMKPERGRDQAAMQVKGLSSEKRDISEADTFHMSGRRNRMRAVKGEAFTALAESETAAWNQEDDLGIWETQGVIRQCGLRSNKP